MSRIKTLLLFAFAFFIISCSDDDQHEGNNISFESFGLESRIVYKLKIQNNLLYAATDNGIFKNDISNNLGWESIGLQNENVEAFDVKGNLLFAATSNPSQEDYRLYRSNDGGMNWVLVESNYGDDFPEPYKALKFHPVEDKIFATGFNVIVVSENLGIDWQVVYGAWGSMSTGLSFVEINELTEDIWAGGQNAIEGFKLYRVNTNDTVEWNTLLPSPSVAKDIAFHPVNTNEVLIGAEGGIIKTIDNGATWASIKENHEDARFYFGIDYDLIDPNVIYAAGWLKNFSDPQPLILNISRDKGDTWEEHKYPDLNLMGGVYDMLMVNNTQHVILYMGLYKGGVFKVTVK